MPVFALNNDIVFPHPELSREDGLLAVGGDLSLERLLLAYENGIFPWFNEEDPPLWWCPEERAVILLDELKVSKSLRQEMRKEGYEIRYNTSFDTVIRHCQTSRSENEGTWITEDIIQAYNGLHEMGIASSVETYFNGELVGGLYGLIMGKVYCGESMFSLRSNASKIALYHLTEVLKENEFDLIDCQINNSHLSSLGSREIPRKDFLEILITGLKSETREINWPS